MNKVNNKTEYNLYWKFVNQSNELKNKKKQTKDVLNKAPIRYLAYSNEIGSAISPINKSLGTILWVPALLYLGADIYDKYKNEDTTYSPSAKRSLRQAIFQGFASVILPSSAIGIGQKIGVRIAGEKDSLSALDKKELVEFTLNHLNNNGFPKSTGESFKDSLIDSFSQRAISNEIKVKNRSFFDKLSGIFKETQNFETVISKYLKNKDKRESIIHYLATQGNTVDEILKSEQNIQASKYIKYFNKANIKYNNAQIARHETVVKLLKDKTINKSIVATLSGFIALLIMIQPIDYFVETILMEKIVNPILDKFPSKKD